MGLASVHAVAHFIHFDQMSRFVPFCPVLSQMSCFVPCPWAPRTKTQKSAMVTMVTSCFSPKVLWSRLWSRLWSLWSLRFSQKPPRPDHSDHSLTIGLTIALLLPNKRATIVTIALFWVLARGAQGHGTKRDKLDKTGQNETKWTKWPTACTETRPKERH